MFRLRYAARIIIFLLLILLLSCNYQPKKVTSQSKELTLRILQQVLAVVTPNTSPKITSFLFLAPHSIGNIQDNTITLTLPTGTNATNLKAVFTYTGKTLTVNDIPQTSGETINDFTNPVTYKLTSSDGTEKSYTVTVTLN